MQVYFQNSSLSQKVLIPGCKAERSCPNLLTLSRLEGSPVWFEQKPPHPPHCLPVSSLVKGCAVIIESLSCCCFFLLSPLLSLCFSFIHQTFIMRTSLVVQLLGLHTSTARGTGLIPGTWGTKIPHARWRGQKQTKTATKTFMVHPFEPQEPCPPVAPSAAGRTVTTL